MDTYDVVVIGAGVHGASAAFHLTNLGAKVAVLEKGFPASGPTGLSSAVVRSFYSNAYLGEMAAKSMAMFEDFADLTHGGDCGFRQVGALFIQSAEHLDETKRILSATDESGMHFRLLNSRDVHDLVDHVVPGPPLLGIWEQRAGYADPSATTNSLLNHAVSRGAELKTNSEVRSIERRHSAWIVRASTDRSLQAKKLLVAAGPWTSQVLSGLGVTLPLTAERHVVATYRAGGLMSVPFVIGDLDNAFYLKPEMGELFILGGLDATEPIDPDVAGMSASTDEIIEIGERASRRLSPIEDCQPVGGWAGLYDVSPDWQPVIGEVEEDVFVDAGTSGHGFKLAPALGEEVARLVLGASHSVGIKQFHPDRFATGRLIQGSFSNAPIIG